MSPILPLRSALKKPQESITKTGNEEQAESKPAPKKKVRFADEITYNSHVPYLEYPVTSEVPLQLPKTTFSQQTSQAHANHFQGKERLGSLVDGTPPLCSSLKKPRRDSAGHAEEERGQISKKIVTFSDEIRHHSHTPYPDASDITSAPPSLLTTKFPSTGSQDPVKPEDETSPTKNAHVSSVKDDNAKEAESWVLFESEIKGIGERNRGGAPMAPTKEPSGSKSGNYELCTAKKGDGCEDTGYNKATAMEHSQLQLFQDAVEVMVEEEPEGIYSSNSEGSINPEKSDAGKSLGNVHGNTTSVTDDNERLKSWYYVTSSDEGSDNDSEAGSAEEEGRESDLRLEDGENKVDTNEVEVKDKRRHFNQFGREIEEEGGINEAVSHGEGNGGKGRFVQEGLPPREGGPFRNW